MSLLTTHSANNVTSSTYPINTTTPAIRDLYEEYDDWLPLAWASYYIDQQYLWFIFALGFPGNIATIVTILNSGNLVAPSFYVLLLAVVDNVAIVIKLLYHQLQLRGVPLQIQGCKTLKFLGSFVVALANWILVTLAVERFLVIHFPFSVTGNRKYRLKKAVFCILLESVVLMCVFSPVLWTHSYIYDPNLDKSYCGDPPEFQHFIKEIWHWVDSVVYAYIPCLTLVAINVLIIKDLSRSVQTRSLLTKSVSAQRTVDSNLNITIMLVSSSVVFIVVTVPICIYFIIDNYWQVSRYTVQEGGKNLFRDIAFILCDINHALNFYIYFIGAKNFRGQFCQVFLCRKRTPKHSVSIRMTSIGQ